MPSWLGRWSEWRTDIAAAVVLGLFLGVLGPFGSFLNGGIALRMAYWSAMLVLGLFIYSLGIRYALHLGARWRQPDWFVIPLALILLALPMSLIVAQVCYAIWPVVRRYMHPFDWYGQSLVLSLPFSAIWLWAHRSGVRGAELSVPQAQAVASQALLTQSLGRRLICLQMEDHYVRIHTDAGSELVLSPLKDAIDAVSSVDGLQVHRSWWVARNAVVRAVRQGRNWELELDNGLRAPVSRPSIVKLKAAGWLPDQ